MGKEEDINKCKELIKEEKSNWIGIANQKAIEHLLKEIEEDKNRINKLEKENKEILNSKIGIDLSYDDYIPKQKVKDKIEELKEDKESKYYDKFLESRDIENSIKILKELLEGK